MRPRWVGIVPTPLGHGIAGLAVYIAGGGKLSRKPDRKSVVLIALCITFGLAPDLDFFHWSDGSLKVSGVFHHGVSHSIGFAFFAGFFSWSVARAMKITYANNAGLLAFASYALHVVLDLFGHDFYPVNGIGLPALWPFTDQYFIVALMPGVNRADPFTLSSFYAVILEILLTGALLVLAYLIRRRHSAKS